MRKISKIVMGMISVSRRAARCWLSYSPVHSSRYPSGRFTLCPTSVMACLTVLPRSLPRTLYRSEEHTSELQSRSDLVCRLLLEKKKKTRTFHQLFRAHSCLRTV